jgi:hypothetical protein
MADVQMNELGAMINELLKRYTIFPTPILVAQCKFIGTTPGTVKKEDLAKLAPYIGRAVALFSNPEKGRELEKAVAAMGS